MSIQCITVPPSTEPCTLASCGSTGWIISVAESAMRRPCVASFMVSLLHRRHAAVVLVREVLHEELVYLEVHSAQHARLLRVGQEGALEAVDDDALDLVGPEVEGARRERDLLRHGGGRDQSRVGVEGDPQPSAEVVAEGMHG